MIFLFLIRTCSSSPDSGSNGEIEVFPTTVEFAESDTLSPRYVEIVNHTKKRVCIYPVAVPCSCLSVNIENSIIKPGEKGKVGISYLGSYDKPSLYSIYVKIGVNGEEESDMIYLLSIRVTPDRSFQNDLHQEFQIIPSSINFGKTDKDCVESQLSIANTSDKSIFIEEIYTSCVCVTTDYDSNDGQLKPGEKRNIHVCYNNHGSIEPVHFKIYIKTDISSKPYVVDLFANQK